MAAIEALDALERTPEITAAIRFAVFACALATCIVSLHYARATSGVNVPSLPLYGLSVESAGVCGLYGYYWLKWRYTSWNDYEVLSAMADIRHVTSFFMILIVIGGAMIISPFLKRWLGGWWPVGAGAVILMLSGLGYGDATWR